MKNISWEIVLAGLLFIVLGTYLANKPQNRTATNTVEVGIDSVDTYHVNVDLKNLENLSELEKLKDLAELMPPQIREDFIAEIDKTMNDFEKESIDVNIDLSKVASATAHVYAHPEAEGNWSRISPGVYIYQKEFDGSGLDQANISMPFGSITVIGSDKEKSKISIQASGKISSAEDLGSKLRSIIHLSDGDVAVKVESIGDAHNQNIQLQTTITLPEHIDLSTTTKAGHIDVTNIKGDMALKTAGGHIALHNLKGDVTAYTAGGHISAEESMGDMTLESAGGHISAKDCNGDLVLKTAGGHIEVENTIGDMSASTQGGNIDFNLNNLSGDIYARTGAGVIQFQLPKNEHASLNLKANTIEIDPAFNFKGEKTLRQVDGVLNSGGSDIIATTSYGKIIIKPND